MSDWSLPYLIAKRELKEAEAYLQSNDPIKRTYAAMHVEQAMVQLAKILAWTEK